MLQKVILKFLSGIQKKFNIARIFLLLEFKKKFLTPIHPPPPTGLNTRFIYLSKNFDITFWKKNLKKSVLKALKILTS